MHDAQRAFIAKKHVGSIVVTMQGRHEDYPDPGVPDAAALCRRGLCLGAGNAIETAIASVVVLDTDAGLTGCREFCPCGESYMESHSQGVVGTIRLLAPHLLGTDLRQVAMVEQLMDRAIRGHGYAKVPVDAACWDLLGKATGQPV